MVQYTASQTSLVKSPSSMTEMYIPLWVYSSGSVNSVNTSANPSYIQKGTTGTTTLATASAVILHAHNTNWSADQTFAFEASLYIGSSSYSATAMLWDIQAGIAVTSISTSSTTFTVIRSSQFTLTSGHNYAVRIYTGSNTVSAYLTKAHLVAFL